MAEQAVDTIDFATMYRADRYLPPLPALDNEAYLVSRGVRPLALVGHCPADPVLMLRIRTVLDNAAQAELVLPFIFPERGNRGMAAFGYAAHRWVIDHLEWALSGEIPAARKHEILGLLCGYSASAIGRHQEQEGLWAYQPGGEGGGT